MGGDRRQKVEQDRGAFNGCYPYEPVTQKDATHCPGDLFTPQALFLRAFPATPLQCT